MFNEAGDKVNQTSLLPAILRNSKNTIETINASKSL